jgi:hypothetical protein
MPEGTRSAPGFAVQAEVQHESVKAVADQYFPVHSSEGDGLLACHASRDLGAPGSGVERLLVVVHGALRDSDRYFRHVVDAAGAAGPSTLIVAPQFLADVDQDARASAPPGTLYWEVEGWKGGHPALGPAPVSSFRAMDWLLEHLTAPGRLPGSEKPAVVIAGNSAGGQYVNRYAAVGRAPDALARRGISVRFIIANPSTYLYFNDHRPVETADKTGINLWRYGFDQAPAYVDSTADQSLERYLGRDVTIVLGAEDRDNGALLLEVSAAAMAQGANRFERGINYNEYIQRLARAAGLTARHTVIALDGIGHDAADVLAAPQTRAIMFG